MFLPLTIVLTLTSRRRRSPRRADRDRRAAPTGATRRRPSLHPGRPSARRGRRTRRPQSALAGDGDRRHADRAGLEQRRGAGRERRAGRHDVVDEDDPAARERPRRPRDRAAGRAQAERAGDVRRPCRSVEVELGDRRPGALEDRRAGQAERRPRRRGRSAPPGRSRGGARRSAWTGTGTRTSPPAPTRCQRRAIASPSGTASRARRRTSAAWSASPDEAGERRAPLELEQRRRDVRRQPDRRPGRRSSRASSAGRHAAQIGGPSRPQPGSGREGEVERRATPRRSIRAAVTPEHAVAAFAGLTAASTVRHRPALTDPATTRSPTAVAVASIVPTGSSRTPSAPRTSGTSPRPRRAARGGPTTTGRAPSAAGSADEHRVDREAHEHHVDPVARRAATGRAPAASDGRPIRPMNLPHSEPADLERARRGRCRGSRSRARQQRGRPDVRSRQRRGPTNQGDVAAQVDDDQDDRRAQG